MQNDTAIAYLVMVVGIAVMSYALANIFNFISKII